MLGERLKCLLLPTTITRTRPRYDEALHGLVGQEIAGLGFRADYTCPHDLSRIVATEFRLPDSVATKEPYRPSGNPKDDFGIEGPRLTVLNIWLEMPMLNSLVSSLKNGWREVVSIVAARESPSFIDGHSNADFRTTLAAAGRESRFHGAGGVRPRVSIG